MAWECVGRLDDLPAVLLGGRYPLTDWELGVRSLQDDVSSVLPLRVTAGAHGTVLALPLAGVL